MGDEGARVKIGEKEGTSERSARLAGRILRTLDRAIGALATGALAALIAIVFANVTARYLFRDSLVWAEEAGIWLFVYIIFLGLPLAQRAQLHPSLTLLVDALPPRLRRGAELLAEAVLAYVTLMLLLAGLVLMQRIGGTSPALLLPAWRPRIQTVISAFTPRHIYAMLAPRKGFPGALAGAGACRWCPTSAAGPG